MRRVAETEDQRRAREALAIALTIDGEFDHMDVWARMRREGDDLSPSECWRALMSHVPHRGEPQGDHPLALRGRSIVALRPASAGVEAR